ncbi:MAG TPA: hypothetical protein ENK61_00805 [Devosia sp.]|nr:hypothetical protein [Devosia sp.]
MRASEAEACSQKSSKLLRVLFLLWVAFVAFALPEIIAGTGAGWLVSPFVFILVIPLYASHFLFLTHIAVKTGRTSWPALYIFGLIFGLYETWVTKVIWSGYPGEEGFAMGTIGTIGTWFGVHETLGLVMFYHAVVSFLLPIVVLSTLFPGFGRHFPVGNWLLAKTRWGAARRTGLLLMLGIVSGFNMADVGLYLFTWVPALVVSALGYWGLSKTGMTAIEPVTRSAVTQPNLGRAGLGLTLVVLVLIYGITYGLILPENLPPKEAQFITLALYLVLMLILIILPTREKTLREIDTKQLSEQRTILVRWIVSVFLLGLLTSVFASAGGMAFPAFFIGVTFVFAGMVIVGVVLFLWLVIWRGIFRRGKREESLAV